MGELFEEKTRKRATGYQENRVVFLPAYNSPIRVASKMERGVSYDVISSPIVSAGIPAFTTEASWHMLSRSLF